MDAIIMTDLATEINETTNSAQLKDIARRAARIASVTDLGYKHLYTALAMKAAHKAVKER